MLEIWQGREAVKAYAGENGSVVYEMNDGSKDEWLGGSRAWRNNNPGNVRFVKMNNWQGQIGEAGGFCVFKEREWGERATLMILRKYAARGLTLGEGIATYAPASENDVAAYVRAVQDYAGIGAGIRMETLKGYQLRNVAQGIFRHEGWKVGTTRKYKK